MLRQAVVGLATVLMLAACATDVQDQGIQGVGVPLPTSTWESTEPAMAAGPLEGTLVHEEDGCLRIHGDGGVVTTPVWPKGYSAATHAGTVSVYSNTGEVVASEGERIAVGGGSRAAEEYPGQPCLATGSSYEVNSEVMRFEDSN